MTAGMIFQTSRSEQVELLCPGVVCHQRLVIAWSLGVDHLHGSLVKSYITPRAMTKNTHASLWYSGGVDVSYALMRKSLSNNGRGIACWLVVSLDQHVVGHELTSSRRFASRYRPTLDLPFPTVEAFHVWWPNRPPSRMAHGLVCLAVEMSRSFQAMTFHYLQSRLLRADIRSQQDGRRISQTTDQSSTCLKCYRPLCRR